jgi:hypothetical protein
MSDNEQGELTSLPLLVKFAQLQLDNAPACCYDALQHLNISTENGDPIVASAHARSMLKTQSPVKQWAED